jgi:hypothetical protein
MNPSQPCGALISCLRLGFNPRFETIVSLHLRRGFRLSSQTDPQQRRPRQLHRAFSAMRCQACARDRRRNQPRICASGLGRIGLIVLGHEVMTIRAKVRIIEGNVFRR